MPARNILLGQSKSIPAFLGCAFRVSSDQMRTHIPIRNKRPKGKKHIEDPWFARRAAFPFYLKLSLLVEDPHGARELDMGIDMATL